MRTVRQPHRAVPAPRFFRHVQGAPGPAIAAGTAQGDRRDRRAGPSPADGARRHHRPPDPGEADPGSRLGVSPGARGQHDARAGPAPSRHPAARHHREHLARHHLDLHLRPGAVLGACRRLGRRIRDAGFGALSLRLRRAVCRRISARRPRSKRWRNRRAIWRWSRRSPAARRGGSRSKRTARRRSSPACRSSNAPIIRPHCRCS